MGAYNRSVEHGQIIYILFDNLKDNGKYRKRYVEGA